MPETSLLEERLNDFNAEVRRAALRELAATPLPAQGTWFNMHCHSTYSYNGYGYSPQGLAWKGRREGLYGMALVDFDVLDGVEEFLEACRLLGLRYGAGFESRVFIPEFATRVMNSPGEPGISYHVGMGFTSCQVKDDTLLRRLKDIAQSRNRGMVGRVNAYLDPVVLDYDADVLPLTPKGNATERHICAAYDAKARTLFPDAGARAAYWAEKLGTPVEKVAAILDNAPQLHGLIRGKTMKAGGAGYVKPEGPDFPGLVEVNQFILENGGIPSYAFVDGTSEGEAALEELLDVNAASGAAALTVIPDRNWNFSDPEVKRRKVELLGWCMDIARARDLPVVVGTEMNAPGQKFVDQFDEPSLAPYFDDFLAGANILHAHTLLQAHAGMGYLSAWARANFNSIAEKNDFFRRFGAAFGPDADLSGIGLESTAADIARKMP